MQMWVYVVRRLLLLIPVVLGVMTITFILVSGIPSNQRCLSQFGPPPIHGGEQAISAYYAHCYKVLGLNVPVYQQWAVYMGNTLDFHWGNVGNFTAAAAVQPFITGQPVTTVLGWLLPYTIELALLSLAIILIVAIPLGRLAAVYRNRPVDQASRVMSFSGFAIPSFLLGSLALIGAVLVLYNLNLASACNGPFNALHGSWPAAGCMPGSVASNNNYPPWLVGGIHSTPTGFPTIDAAIHGQWIIAGDTILRIIIPALIIAYGTIAVLLRFVRNSMLEVMNLDFIRTARAKGVTEHVVTKRHAGRNSLNVTITVLGLTFAFFIGGFPIIEEVFGLNGVGRALALSVLQPYDFGLIFGTTILFTLIVVIANIIVDVVYAYLDPRVRLG
ncbi:MAG TPA: ABC transporter permease [Thermoplasmata archaeon]|nr:ABC transporter permease [Thermoplasmata archaeon]